MPRREQILFPATQQQQRQSDDGEQQEQEQEPLERWLRSSRNPHRLQWQHEAGDDDAGPQQRHAAGSSSEQQQQRRTRGRLARTKARTEFVYY